jgi:hypothetical protein
MQERSFVPMHGSAITRHRLALPSGAGSTVRLPHDISTKVEVKAWPLLPAWNDSPSRGRSGRAVGARTRTTHVDRLAVAAAADLQHPPHRDRPGDQVVEPGELQKRAWNGSVSGSRRSWAPGAVLIPRPSGARPRRRSGYPQSSRAITARLRQSSEHRAGTAAIPLGNILPGR